MYKSVIAITVFLYFFCGRSFASGCPDSGSDWQTSDVSFKYLTEQIASIDSSCFCNVLSGTKSESRKSYVDSLASFIGKWIEHHDVSNQVLFSCYRNGSIYKKYPVWSSIIAGWQRDNEPVYDEFVNLVKRGLHSRADTLFTIFDAEGKLDSHDWLRWAKIKGLIGDYSKIAGLYCRAIQREHLVGDVALHQFGRVLEELEPGVAERILQQFCECSLGKPDSDTLSIRSWLADSYLKLGLLKQELNTLKDMGASGFPVTSRFLEAARFRFSIHKYRDAIDAAIMSYQSTDRIALKSMAATILYKSYLNLGVSDTAVQWINRADLGSDKNRVEAVTFYQSVGDYTSAAQLIDSLPKSKARDSLTLRQFLLQGEIKKAASYISNNKLSINADIMSGSLWKSRIVLFSGKVNEITAYFDTLEIEPYWECAGELISYQYWVQLIGKSSEALAAWASIEYNLYTGAFNSIVQVFSKYHIPAEYQWQLALHASKACLIKGHFNQALLLLKFDTEVKVSPEFLYYRAEALYRNGENDSAMQIFSQIILEHSADLFSEKARIFLIEHGLIKK